ncbi:hypothetical protein FACS1894186_3630 [Alphaproteobacteria bacterium]|nr:hypothetical protein FACS1894186_3630 [Alphaproteobacteria bacterium]
MPDLFMQAKPKPLTPRQTEVLKWLAHGHSNKAIAFAVGISEATVKLHFNALMRRLQASNRTHALAIAVKHGLITL